MSQISRLKSAEIANGNLINADDIGAELDQLVSAHNANDTTLTDVTTNAYTFSGVKTFSSTPLANAINERTAGTGITLDDSAGTGVLVKDGTVGLAAAPLSTNGTIGYATNQFQGYRNGSLLNFLMTGDVSQSITPTTKSANYTAVAGDRAALIRGTGTWTLSLTAAATLTSGWYLYLRNEGTGNITIDPNSTEQVNGATTIVAGPGSEVIIVCDGTGFYTIGKLVYESSGQTITSAGSLTLAHSLGVKPKSCFAILVCGTGEQGYSAGDEVVLHMKGGASTNRDCVVVADATNLTVRYGSTASNVFNILHKTTGSDADLTNGNWTVKFRAQT